MTQKEIMQKAIETYGAEKQIDMAIEEMSELIKALLKHRRALIELSDIECRRAAENDVTEEIADVEIMLEQMKIIFNCHYSVDGIKNYKLNRLKSRLE